MPSCHFSGLVLNLQSFNSNFYLQNEEENGEGTPVAFKRSPEDLRMYNHLFPELFEIDYIEDTGDSIVIPTASQEIGVDREKRQNQCGIYPVTVDTLNKPSTSNVYRMSTSASDFTDTSGYSSGRNGRYVDSPGGEYEVIDSYSRSESAAGIKTGATIISIDFPSSQSNKTSKKTSNQKSKKPKGSKKAVKKPKKLTKDTNLDGGSFITSPLCITPIQNTLEQEDDSDLFLYDEEDDFCDLTHDPLMYQEIARQTKSIYKFDKIAYPDLCGALSPYDVEPLYHRKFGVQR